jgi:hypothetical protein
MSFYDEGKYGVVTRTWFGLTTKMGGSGDVPVVPTAGSASSETLVTRWYPRGPIEVLKVGWRVVATASAAANATGASDRARVPIEFYKSNAAGTARSTLIASDAIKLHPVANTVGALWSVSSKETMASSVIEAGRFVTIFMATAESNEGTAAAAIGTTFISGSYARFMDWIPKFNAKWGSLKRTL